MSKNVMFIGSYEFAKGFSEKSDLFGRLLDICLPIIYSERKIGSHFTELPICQISKGIWILDSNNCFEIELELEANQLIAQFLWIGELMSRL